MATLGTQVHSRCSMASIHPLANVPGLRRVACSAAHVDIGRRRDVDHGLARQAHVNGTLGFGFSAGGLLFPYYVGLVNGLRQAGALTDTTPVAGASAGSLIAACSKLGLTHDQLTEATLELAAECRRLGTRHNLGPILEQSLRRLLPEDAHERAMAGRVHVAVTCLQPKVQPVLVDKYVHIRAHLLLE